MNKIESISVGDFIKIGNSCINLKNVLAIEEKNKCITFYYGIFMHSTVCENDIKEDAYKSIKDILRFN